jgi:diguanylate cyclase (GGDEF)-like protein
MLLNQVILILDANIDKSSDNPDLLKQSSYIYPLITNKISEAFELIEEYEPDLILAHDNFEESLVETCYKIREKTSFYRPVLLVLSYSDDIEKKLEILKAGADDYQNENTNPAELSLRIFAHLRRHVEELTDPVTKLPATSLSYRILKRNIELKTREIFALMYVDIDNYFPYREIYGSIAAEKLLQTFIAIIRTSLSEGDFLGRVGDDDFVVLTSPEKAEKIAMFLSYSFDMVSPKFYTTEDINRGYLILDGDEKIGRRIPLVSVSIGIVSNQYSQFSSFEEVINKAISVHNLAKSKPGSFWISDKPKVTGGDSSKDQEKKILVVENDAALSYLLITTLEMQGYNVEAINSTDQTMETIEKIRPDLVVLDISEENSEFELELCKIVKEKHAGVKIIVSTSDCNKEKVLNTGVDLYIPKPYELMVLFSWISRFLNYEVLQ